MVIDIILTIAGAGVLLLLTFGGLIATQGRKSASFLIAPRGARFGEASGLVRKSAREQQVGPNTDRGSARTVVELATFAQSDRHAA